MEDIIEEMVGEREEAEMLLSEKTFALFCRIGIPSTRGFNSDEGDERRAGSLWPFKRELKPSLPQLQDNAVAELAQMFLHHPESPTPGSDQLDASRFDFSVASLGVMDTHLEQMRGRQLDDREWSIFILRAGAYVGEVIRRHSLPARQWHWLAFEQAAAMHPFVASLGMSVGTAAVLWDGKDGIVFPLAKVGKYIQNGAEDSVLFYAQVVIAGPPSP